MVAERNPRKRQRSALESVKDAEDDGKKQRGRPRVEGQDETAADRRRTQIRLAQRAYRQRKESTIATLKDQVNALQSTIEEMNKAFLNFNDKAVASGVLQAHPGLARELKSATEQFILLARAAGSSSDGESVNSDTEGPNDTERLLSSTTAIIPSPMLVPLEEAPLDIGLGYMQVFSDSSDALSPEQIASSSAYDENMQIDNNNNNIIMSTETADPFNSTTAGTTRSLFDLTTTPESIRLTTNTTAYNSQLPTPPPMTLIPSPLKTISLNAPYTFSLDETSFSRRLQRAALERGFHLLSTASLRPAAFRRVFRLSLMYHSPEALLQKFRSILTNSVAEPLEFFHTPFIHLGGAGTHYSNGRVKNGYIIKPGPNPPIARLQNVENGTDPGIDLDFDMEEYAGVWFDSNDVEGYLEERGIRIDPQQSFIEVSFQSGDVLSVLLENAGVRLPANNPSPPNTDPTTNTSPATSAFKEDLLDFGAATLFPEIADIDSSNFANNATAWLLGSGDRTPDFLNSGWVGIEQPSAWDGGDLFDFDPLITNVPAVATKVVTKKYSLMLDVSKMVDELIKTGICLGRAPGFRRKDVDRALTSSVIQVV